MQPVRRQPIAPPRIVANQLDNSLLIQADPQRYQSILKILKELDVPPRQILLDAKIYEVDLEDEFSSGLSWALQPLSAKPPSATRQASSGPSTAPGSTSLPARW